MNQILITNETLASLSMLADWQLRQMGIDPDSVTSAILNLEK